MAKDADADDDSMKPPKRREKPPDVPDDELYEAVIEYLEGKAPPKKYRTTDQNTAYRKVHRNKLYLAKDYYNPLFAAKVDCVMYENLILPRQSDVPEIIKMYLSDTSYENALKLHEKIKQIYAGISRAAIQGVINKDPQHAQVAPKFLNKPQSRPIEAIRPMEINQADLVNMTAYAVIKGEKTFRFILSVIDVFSRFLWLVPLQHKDPVTVAAKLYKIYIKFDSPVKLQTDRGTEFKSEVKLLCSHLGTRIIYSRAHHPQSQGIVERSHGTWKNKIKHDMIKEAEKGDGNYTWVDALSGYARAYNEGLHRSLGASPFEVFFGRKCNRLRRFRPERDANESLTDEEIEIESDVEEEQRQDILQQHMEFCEFIREKAQERATHQSNKQTRRLLNQRTPSVYFVGDKVLVNKRQPDEGLARGGKKLSKKRGEKGEVIESDPDNFRYKVCLEDEASTEAWYNVEYIIMKTPEEELEKQKLAKKNVIIGKKCKCANSECMRLPAKECSYGMHRLCCHASKTKSRACGIESHNPAEQGWRDYQTIHGKEKRDKERKLFEDMKDSTWLLHGFESFVSMQAWLLASYKKTRDDKLSKSKQKKQRQTLHNNLEEKALKKKLTIQDCGGRGECFFACVADQINVRLGVSMTPLTIREKAVAYLLDHPTFAGQHVGAFIEVQPQWAKRLQQLGLDKTSAEGHQALVQLYAEDMMQTTTWADNIIIMAVAECLKYDLLIVSANPVHVDALIRFSGSDGNGIRLTVGHIAEMHYVSLRPQQVQHHEKATEAEAEESMGEKEEEVQDQLPKKRKVESNDEGQLLTPVVMQATLEDAEAYITQVAHEELSRGIETPQDVGDPLAHVDPDITPLHIDDAVAVKLFLKNEAEQGIEHEVINSHRGAFALLDKEAMLRFDNFKITLPLNTLIHTSPAFFYFITQSWQTKSVHKIKQWAEDVWEIDINLMFRFNEWFQSEKFKKVQELRKEYM